MVDNLNAEIALGTVTSVPEAVQWLGYSYLYIRMLRNPLTYGIDWAEIRDDPTLVSKTVLGTIKRIIVLHWLEL
jgi:antiviral helicase SLH1